MPVSVTMNEVTERSPYKAQQDSPTDPDAPTLLVYAPVSWLDRSDMYGDLHDDDSTGDDPLYTYPDDYDEDGRYCRPHDLDVGDGLDDDCDNPAVHDPDWLPF